MVLLLSLAVFGARVVPDMISDVGRADVSDEGVLPELADDSDSDIPTDPVEPMEEAVNIYIHVILMLDEGPPPPSGIRIVSINTSNCLLKSDVSPSVLGAVDFNIYRNTNMPMYYADDLVEFIGNTGGLIFGSDLYFGIPNPGPGNPDVNYFYVFTSVDHLGNESTYPSPNVCEYDQRIIKSNGLASSRNFVSYPCDHGFESLMDVIDGYPEMVAGVDKIEKWDYNANNFSTVISYVPFGGGRFVISGDTSIELGDVFCVDFRRGSSDTTIFFTNVPGIIPDDRPYNFVRRSTGAVANHLIMMPFRYSYELSLLVAPDHLKCTHIAADIGEEYIVSIGQWNAFAQNINNMATWVPFGGGSWVGSTDPVKPGSPYIVRVAVNRPETWPPTVVGY